MLRLAALLGACVTLSAPVAAQEFLGSYYTLLGAADMRNSRGVPLGDFCAIVQQDRANFHRFGVRDQFDQPDPWFGTLEARQKLSSNCYVVQGFEYIPAAVLRGEARYIHVMVFGQGGWPQWVEIQEGAG